MTVRARSVAVVLALSGCADASVALTDATDTHGSSTTKGADDAGLTDTKSPEASSGDTGQEDDDTAETTGTSASDGDTGDRTTGVDDAPGIDDAFDGDLSLWEVLDPGGVSLSIVDTALRFEPAATTLWYHGSSGPLLWQLVEGDFVVTADVTARGIADADQPPLPSYRVGGLMARDASGSTENYVFVALGSPESPEAVEYKTTTDDHSLYQETPWSGSEGELRICRIGARFEVLVRERGGAWQSLEVYDRPDLSDGLQVGPFGFAYQDDPDLRVIFDWVRFERPSEISDCAQ